MITTYTGKVMVNDIKSWLKERLSGERYSHSLGSEESARELAIRFNADPDRAAFAALVHDNAKCIPDKELLKIINENNLPVSEMEKMSTKTLHAPVSAFLAQKELGIDDQEILDAIRYHTIGRINMTPLEKVVYLADKIEPNTRDTEYRKMLVQKLNETANIDEAILLSYDSTIRSLLDRKLFISPETIMVWNSLIQSLKK